MLLLAGYRAYAFQNEPDGFRGIKWGVNIGKLSSMKLIEDGEEVKYYALKNDKMQIGDAELDAIAYGFYKSRFYMVGIKYHAYSNYSAIKETLIQQYGPGSRPNKYVEKYFWFGDNVSVTLQFNEIQETGVLWYLYKPIDEESERDVKEKAKEGARDL